MKPFKYEIVDRKLGKKSEKEVNQQKMRENFLKLYDDIPPNPKMQNYCEQVKQTFLQKRKNSRYYSYDLHNQGQKPVSILRTQKIKKLSNFEMPYKEQISKKEVDKKLQQQKRREEQQRKKQLREKFKLNVRLVISKMRKMKVSIQDIIGNNLFSKQPYKFGSEIFIATKEGNVEKVWRILLQNKFSMFSVDNTLKNALFWACIRGHSKIVKVLIQAGIDINKKDLYGYNAVYYAIKYNYPECMKLLMLNLSHYDQICLKQSKNGEEKMRNIFNLCISLRNNFKGLDIDKRNLLFQEQYKYFYKS